MQPKKVLGFTLFAVCFACGMVTSAGAQTVIIAGPGGQVAEMRHDGGFSLSLPGRPSVYSGGYLYADGGRREFWLIDYYFGLMAHAEVVLDEDPGRLGRGRLEFFGPWGYVSFSGAAWEIPTPNEGEEELHSPHGKVFVLINHDCGGRAALGALRCGAARRARHGRRGQRPD